MAMRKPTARHKSNIIGVLSGFPDCCQLHIVHDLQSKNKVIYPYLSPERDSHYLAVSANYQKDQQKALRDSGFKPIAKMPGSDKSVTLTLWLRKRTKR